MLKLERKPNLPPPAAVDDAGASPDRLASASATERVMSAEMAAASHVNRGAAVPETRGLNASTAPYAAMSVSSAGVSWGQERVDCLYYIAHGSMTRAQAAALDSQGRYASTHAPP